jgi:hypothetical protein
LFSKENIFYFVAPVCCLFGFWSELHIWWRDDNNVDKTFLECNVYQEFKKFRPLIQ